MADVALAVGAGRTAGEQGVFGALTRSAAKLGDAQSGTGSSDHDVPSPRTTPLDVRSQISAAPLPEIAVAAGAPVTVDHVSDDVHEVGASDVADASSVDVSGDLASDASDPRSAPPSPPGAQHVVPASSSPPASLASSGTMLDPLVPHARSRRAISVGDALRTAVTCLP
jgi:hypothetical protein